MTVLSIEIDMQVHVAALNYAESVGAQSVDPNSAGKASANAIIKSVAPIWEKIREAIESAVEFGESTADELWVRVKSSLDEAAKESGEAIEALSDELRKRLSAYVKRVEQMMLDNVSAKILVGGVSLALKSIDIQKSLKMSSSLKANLIAAVGFAAGGEMSVKASYA